MPVNLIPHHGAPTPYIHGKPAFYGLMWGAAPGPENYLLKECAQAYAKAGIHLFTFDIGTQSLYPEWLEPRPGSVEPFDFTTLQQRFQQILDADPQAQFHLRIHLEMPAWWQKLYPEECELLSDGRRMSQSYASRVWRQQAKEFLRRLVVELKNAGLYERILAYQAGAGDTGEWVKGHGAMSSACGDFSLPMQVHFKDWLRQKYHHDEQLLQKSWNNPGITFETVQVPTAERQLSSTLHTFRHPLQEADVIDYYRCLADLCADVLIDFCTTIKDATQGNALVGAFYGYLMELSWNSAFFGERGEATNSQYSTTQRSGHLGLQKVLASPAVDFLVSPYSYGFRGIGGDGPTMLPSESARLHGKLVVIEDDTRTHLSLHDQPNYGKADSLSESLAILKRNFASALTRGHAIWWLAGGGPASPHIDLAQEPAFQPLLNRLKQLGAWSLNLERSPQAEIALLVDDESFFFESLTNELDLPLIFLQRLWGLPRLGASFDTYLLSDLIAGALPPYKLYIFLNAFQLDARRRTLLQAQIQQGDRTALWVYAPGFIQDDFSLRGMFDLTGFEFERSDTPWGPLMQITDFQHPITQSLPHDLSWGVNSRLGPLFHLADPTATVLGKVVYSRGRCQPGFGVKVYPNWKSIYLAVPNIPAPVLRGIARYAGVHVYSDQGDVLYATAQLLSVHSQAGGLRTFLLPHPVELVYDLFEQQVIARNCSSFQVRLTPASTALYFTGPSSLIDEKSP